MTAADGKKRLTIDRALETYLKKGYSPEWVHQRLPAIRIRNELNGRTAETGRSAVTSQNAAQLNQVVVDMIEGMIVRPPEEQSDSAAEN